MTADFDNAADNYDAEFTYSHIGKYQRAQVWKYVDLMLINQYKLSVLELNCGTGEDAKKLASLGHKVIATDISSQMLEVASAKNDLKAIDFMQLDLNQISADSFEDKFDLVYSNFGGLNCIDEEAMRHLGVEIYKLLKPKGQFLAVIMPNFCLWETCYFLLRRVWDQAFRRKKEFALANVSGEQVKTWYFSPARIKRLMPKGLSLGLVRPIGLFLPPSYLEVFFKRHLTSLKYLNFLEDWFGRFEWQASIADHYLIQFIKK